MTPARATVVAVGMFAVIMPLSIAAQENNAELDAAREYVDTITSLFIEGAGLSARINHIERTTEAYLDADIGEDALERAFDQPFDELTSAIERYRSRVSREMEQFAAGVPETDNTAEEFASKVKALPARLSDMLSVLTQLRTAALARDKKAYYQGKADFLYHRAYVYAVKSLALGSALQFFDRGSPRHGLFRARRAINDIVEIDIRVLAENNRDCYADPAQNYCRNPYGIAGGRIEAKLREAERGLADAEAAIERLSQQIDDSRESSQIDRRRQELVLEYYSADAAESRALVAANKRYLGKLRHFNPKKFTKSAMLAALAEFQADIETAAPHAARRKQIRRELRELKDAESTR